MGVLHAFRNGTIDFSNFPIQSGPSSQLVLKPADESVVSSTVFQDDDDFVLPVVANTNYLVDIWLSIQCSSNTPDFKCQLIAPAGTLLTVGWILHDDTNSSGSGILRAPAISSGIIAIRNNNNSQVRLRGPVHVGGTAGTLQLQWAQNTANSNPTIVEADSWMRLEEL